MIFCEKSTAASSSLDSRSSSLTASPMRTESSCTMVYDYVQHDLLGIIRKKIKFNAAQVKYVFKEVLEAVEALHCEHIEHGHLKSRSFLPSFEHSVEH